MAKDYYNYKFKYHNFSDSNLFISVNTYIKRLSIVQPNFGVFSDIPVGSSKS